MTVAYPEPGIRRLVTASVMAATVMNSLDSTIANVALPHIQGSVAASAEEISWVLTSYIVAAAIFTPLTGWFAGRFGRKRLMLFSIVGFTVASGLCGIASTLGEIVGFRLLQGVFGAALVPMSQAILLDINPPERHGPAMSVWAMGAVLGPIVGPALGGWLTDNLSWRWVFFINLPIGVLAFAGLSLFLTETKAAARGRLDLFGFMMLALAIGALQLMLDRGQTKDWFSSLEICIEGGCVLLFGYLFVAHTLTARQPFIDLGLFADVNFTLGSLFGFVLGVLIFSVLALLPPMLEGLLGYPVVLTGLVTAPRGVGSFIAMTAAGILIKRFDPRLLILIGFGLAALSMYQMSGFSLAMDERLMIASGLISGLGTGLIFVPLSTLAFATLPARYRNEGAAMFTLIRNIGSAIGISVLQAMTIRNAATVHSRLVETIRPDNPVMAQAAPSFDFGTPVLVARMNAAITRQASMVSYIDAFWFLFLITLAVMPLLLLLRKPKKADAGDGVALHLD
ncbi:DHA2 family efflux MFS transporter permease subunit [Sphingomonas sp. AP4-R1]|uniref:DHA2 family efflux MFS transporter permease subunit n=1 Tax=Sphingomonas sp. AP4-R1 TaxID=2735134 RepID=UPI001493667C|nr:DHA2 family efflux MFS transporter permease subunit [Sphingomonas sp. AP4-R1]QJU60091.1 DHA2 family efflux MFS transporter permease subunit [Sphingomonas sp. AP4-R1]